jgi:hypothetical protein
MQNGRAIVGTQVAFIFQCKLVGDVPSLAIRYPRGVLTQHAFQRFLDKVQFPRFILDVGFHRQTGIVSRTDLRCTLEK